MSKCKNCLHYEACKGTYSSAKGDGGSVCLVFRVCLCVFVGAQPDPRFVAVP